MRPSTARLFARTLARCDSQTLAANPRRLVKRPDYHSTPKALPKPRSTLIPLALVTVSTFVVWGGFLFYASNEEKSSSSVIAAAVFSMRNDPRCIEFLGEGITIPPLFGEFKIVNGHLSSVAGKVDVQFKVKGSKDTATSSYTAIRRQDNSAFEVLRWKLTRSDGAVLDLLSS